MGGGEGVGGRGRVGVGFTLPAHPTSYFWEFYIWPTSYDPCMALARIRPDPFGEIVLDMEDIYSVIGGRLTLDGDFQLHPDPDINMGQITIAPEAETNPAGVASLTFIPNNPDPGNGQWRDCILSFHPQRNHIEDFTFKVHLHESDGAPGHGQIHTLNAAGDNVISRMEWGFGVDHGYCLVTSSDLVFDDNTAIKPRNAGPLGRIVFKDAANERINFAIENSGVIQIVGEAGIYSPTATAGGVHAVPATVRGYLVFRDHLNQLRKIAYFDQ